MIELGFIHGRFQLFHNDHLQYALLATACFNSVTWNLINKAPGSIDSYWST